MKNDNHPKYLIGLLIIPILIAYGIWRNYKINKQPYYTVGTTIRQISTLKNGLQIEYLYSVNRKTYSAFAFKDERLNIVYPNGTYIVKFSKSDPSISEILWRRPVHSSIQPPQQGWDKIPFGIKEVQ